jgi:hypothetical protein
MMQVKKTTAWLALGVLVLLMASPSFAGKPESFFSSNTVVGQFFFDCSEFDMSFPILADYTIYDYGRFHFDKDGKIVRINGFTYIADRRAYNGTDPSKELTDDVMTGSPEHNHYVVGFDDNEVDVFYKETGIAFKGTVPGYGNFQIGAGAMMFEFVDPDWVPIKFTPNWLAEPDDWYAMCAYLQ